MGTACLDFAMLTERSRRRKLLLMAPRHRKRAAPTPEDCPKRVAARDYSGLPLQLRRVGDDAFEDARAAERSRLDVFPGRDPRERLSGPMVRWEQDRDYRGRVPGARG
jgi:hypothetical protein